MSLIQPVWYIYSMQFDSSVSRVLFTSCSKSAGNLRRIHLGVMLVEAGNWITSFTSHLPCADSFLTLRLLQLMIHARYYCLTYSTCHSLNYIMSSFHGPLSCALRMVCQEQKCSVQVEIGFTVMERGLGQCPDINMSNRYSSTGVCLWLFNV